MVSSLHRDECADPAARCVHSGFGTETVILSPDGVDHLVYCALVWMENHTPYHQQDIAINVSQVGPLY